MELWRVRKEYRQLAVKLRKAPGEQSPAVNEAESFLLLVLCNGERLETELAVLRHARRSARARLRRLRVWLEGAGILKRHVTNALVRKVDELASHELHARLLERGFGELAAVLSHVLREVQHLDRRIEDTRVRLERLSDSSRQMYERLLRTGCAPGELRAA